MKKIGKQASTNTGVSMPAPGGSVHGERANFTRLVLGGGGGGRPDYLQKLKGPAVSKPNFASKYALELGSI